MTFPQPSIWSRDSTDTIRDENKRAASPCSFFFAQGRSLVLAARYFNDERLQEGARGGMALKHRHKINLALFGQLMASFEYMLKDFVARVVDLTPIYDDRIRRCKWLEVSADRILASRGSSSSPGGILLHSSQGWHSPATTNVRFNEIFERNLIENSELPILEKLWIIRHTVAHNAGFVIRYDAVRMAMSDIAERAIDIDEDYINTSFYYLVPVARRLSSLIGSKILRDWVDSVRPLGPSWARDRGIYAELLKLTTLVESRTQELPTPSQNAYAALFS